MWQRFMQIGVLLAGPLSCCQVKDAAADIKTVRQFQLGEKRFEILLPPTAGIDRFQADDSKKTDLLRINFKPGRRHSSVIRLQIGAKGRSHTDFETTEEMRGGRTLHYSVSASRESGSGEPEAFLDGHMSLGDRVYTVRCWIQDYGITINDATWCLPTLLTLKLVPSRQD